MNYDIYSTFNHQTAPVEMTAHDLFDDMDLQDWMETNPSKTASTNMCSTLVKEEEEEGEEEDNYDDES